MCFGGRFALSIRDIAQRVCEQNLPKRRGKVALSAHSGFVASSARNSTSNPRQIPSVHALARQAADAGADAVVIHHPHVASPVLVHKTRDGRAVPLFASVGTLVSNQGESWKPPMFPVLRENRRLVCVNGWTRLGVLADLAFDFGGASPRLTWGFHLTWTENTHADDRKGNAAITTRLVDPQNDVSILEQLSRDEDGPVALFSDPCWRERNAAENPRCGTSLRGQSGGQTPDLTARARRTIRRRQ